MDYQANSHKSKEPKEQKPKEKVEKVVTTPVVVRKKGIGRKTKELLIEADFKSVVLYVFTDVLIPSMKNLFVDSVNKGAERMMYGDSAIRRRTFGAGPIQRITYNNPVNRTYSPLMSPRMAPPVAIGPRTRVTQEDFIIATREEAEFVLERMNDILDQYEVVSVADLNELVNYPTSPIDNKWGWTQLGEAKIRQIREGFLIDFPQPEPIP